jgi:hypothetical protein
MSWVRLDDLSAHYTLFSKDRNAGFPNDNLVFRAFVTSTSGFLAVEMADSDDWTARSTFTASDDVKVVAETWTSVGFSVGIDTNAVDSSVRMWVGDGDGAANRSKTITATGRIYVDDATAHKGYIGAYRTTDASTFAEAVKGFVYSFYVYNKVTATGAPREGNADCGTCSPALCTD